jgi:predicted permease
MIGVRLLSGVAPTLPRAGEVTFGWRGVGLVLLLALVSGALVNLSPVAAALKHKAIASLRGDARRTGTSRGTSAFRAALVVSEFALALPLLLGAGLLLNSFLRLQQVDPGFDPTGVVAVRVALPAVRYADPPAIERFWKQALARLEEVPDLTSVGLVADLPPDTQGQTNNFSLIDHPPAPGGADYSSPWTVATPGYFRTLSIPLLEGRMFSTIDSTTGAPVVLVSRTWARKYFPGESVIGRQMISAGCTTCPRTTVVGVVGDVKYSGMAADGEGVYTPLEQGLPPGMHFVAHIRTSPAAAFAVIRRELAAVDPGLAPVEIVLSERVHASLGDPRRWTGVLGAFAVAGLILAALGIFGLMSYTVRQRRREIGVRLALGAEPGEVTRMIVGRGMRYALVGTVIGLAVAALETRWLRALLYQVETTDPLTVAGSAAVLLLVALAASWLPGWRAARIKPVEAIQTE